MERSHDTEIRSLLEAQPQRNHGEEKARNQIPRIDERDEKKEEALRNPEFHVQMLQKRSGGKMVRNRGFLEHALQEVMVQRENGDEGKIRMSEENRL